MRQEIAIANMERRKGKNERDYGVRQAWLGRVPTHYGSQSTSCQFETRGGICASAPHVGRAPVLPLPGDLEAGRRGKRDRRGREVEGETKERPAERVRGRARERPRPRPRTAQSLFRKSATNLNYPVTGHQTAATADG